jgi:hypothetical protein
VVHIASPKGKSHILWYMEVEGPLATKNQTVEKSFGKPLTGDVMLTKTWQTSLTGR